MHHGSRGHKIKLDVDGGCLDSAHPVMSVQSSRMWCPQGARSLGLHGGSCEVSNLSKQVREEGQKNISGGEYKGGKLRGRRKEGVPLAPNYLHLAPYNSPKNTWLGQRVDDIRFQRFFFSSTPSKR